jgi:uncharacterized membrane protein YbhN (UPF0104 family)
VDSLLAANPGGYTGALLIRESVTDKMTQGQKARTWRHRRLLLAPIISVALLTLLIVRTDASAILVTVSRARLFSWVTAIMFMGLAIFLGSLRWLIGSSAARLKLSVTFALRLTLCGTFFNLLLFGHTSGDIAKSVSYSRWYGLPLERLLAATVIDRGLALGGSLLFALTALAGVLISSHWESVVLPEMGSERPWEVLFVALVVLFALVWLLSRRGGTFLRSLTKTLRQAVRALMAEPERMVLGCMLAYSQQMLMSAVFAVCLSAVSTNGLPWLAVAWTFPLIAVMGLLPFTVAGAGAREGLALVLLSPYGFSPVDIISAGVLTLGVYLFWGGTGSLVAAGEMHRSV